MPKKYYSLDKILEYDASWYVVFGQKSNGKTYTIIRHALEEYFKTGLPFVYLRRYKEELSEFNIHKVLLPHCDLIEKCTQGKYNTLVYYRRRAYLAKVNENGTVTKSKKVVMYTYSLTTYQTENGGDIGETSLIFYDEFFSDQTYLKDEMLKLTTCISNIVRDRTNTKIFLAGNSVNYVCPFFDHTGISLDDLKQGHINEITYKTGTKIVVEWTAANNVTADVSNKLFGFSDRALRLTQTGEFTENEYKKIGYDDLFCFNRVASILFHGKDSGRVNIECYILVHRKTGQPILYFRQSTDEGGYDVIIKKRNVASLFSYEDVTENVIYSLRDMPKVSNQIRWLLTTGRDYYDTNKTGEYVKILCKELME